MAAQILRFFVYQLSLIMSKYLLLRNNKETGPHALEELVGMGLKPYDLVWVEGKSAAWRYPSEIPELAPYAPAVEEQPFDRFFRKTETSPVQVPTPAPVERPLPEKPSFSEYESKYIPKAGPATRTVTRKSVYVTLPPGANNRFAKPVEPSPAETLPPAASQPVPPAALETKYEQSLDDIKDQYMQNLIDRKKRSSRLNLFKTYGRYAAVAIILLGLGLFIGFAVSDGDHKGNAGAATQNNETANLLALHNTPEQRDTSAEPETPIPAEGLDIKHVDITSEESRRAAAARLEKPDPNIVYQDMERVTPVTKAEPTATTIKITPTNTNETSQSSPNYGYEPVAHVSVAGERSKVSREGKKENETVVEKNNKFTQPDIKVSNKIPSHLAEALKVTSNDYKRVALGGIRDLRLTVTNSSNQPLQRVVVELQYIKPNEETLKTEMVNFRFIGAGESSTIRMPDTNRGIKVKYKIVEAE